jgi:hypothetical protein
MQFQKFIVYHFPFSKVVNFDKEKSQYQNGGMGKMGMCTAKPRKRVLHIWPHTLKFDSIQKKYGSKIHFKIYNPENWATLESQDPDIKVRDMLKEYEIPTYDEQIKEATELQMKYGYNLAGNHFFAC